METDAAPARTDTAPLGYQPALDGVRAFAIALVVGFHTDRGGALALLPGGFLGVDVFFVLSGFLITSLLIDERYGAGRIRLGAFWARRIARLFPILWALLAVFAFAKWVHPIAGIHPPSPLGFLALLTYVGNWVPATRHGSLGGLQYLWSLSVEEQFYVVWPPIVAALLALVARGRGRLDGRWVVTGAALLLAATAAGLRATQYPDFFFNAALRSDGLLLGAALAGTRHVWQHRIPPRLANVLVPVSVVVITWIVWGATNLDPHLPTWKLPTLEVAVLGLVAALVAVPTTAIARLAGTAPFVWLGRRSYALYVIHLPVFDVVEAHLGADRPRLRALVEIPIAVVLAHFAHVLIELPAQRKIRRWLHADHRKAEHAPAGPVEASLR